MPDVIPLHAEKFRDEKHNRTIRMVGKFDGKVTYRGYAIVEKRDFGHGFLISAFRVKHGYVVTDGGMINVMPGATWFLTVAAAMRAIDDLIVADSLGERDGEHPFWALSRFRQNAEERAVELATMLQEIVDDIGEPTPFDVVSADIFNRAKALLDQIDDNCDMRPTIHLPDGKVQRQGERTTGRFGL